MITIYKHETNVDDANIWGDNIRDFYYDNSNDMVIESYKIKLDENLRKELEINKVRLLKKELESSLMGLYKYSIIYKQDTFYLSPSTISWLYKNRVDTIKSPFIQLKLREISK